VRAKLGHAGLPGHPYLIPTREEQLPTFNLSLPEWAGQCRQFTEVIAPRVEPFPVTSRVSGRSFNNFRSTIKSRARIARQYSSFIACQSLADHRIPLARSFKETEKGRMTGKKKNRFTALSSADFTEPEVRDTSKTAMGASPDVSHIAAVLTVRFLSLAGFLKLMSIGGLSRHRSTIDHGHHV